MESEKNNHNKELSIRFLPDGFSFYICREGEKTECFSKTYIAGNPDDCTLLLEESVYSNHLLDETYTSVKAVITTPPFTFIPDQLNIPADDYELFLLPDKQNQILITNQIFQAGVKILYYLNEEIYYLLLRLFPDIRFEHQITALSKQYLQLLQKEEDKQSVFIQNNDTSIYTLVSDNGKLYGNHYHCGHSNDVVYFALNLFRHFNMDQLKNKVYLKGEAANIKDIYDLMSRYVKNIVLLPPPEIIQ